VVSNIQLMASGFWDWLKRLWHALVDAVLRTSAHAAESIEQHVDVFSRIEADTRNLINAVRDLEKFDFDPKWNTRVILVPKAIEGIQDIFDLVIHGFRDKFEELYQAVLTLKAALHAPPKSPEPQGMLTNITIIFGQLDKALQTFEIAYKKLTDIVQMLDDVKHRIETLDDLFLQQGNSRRWETVHIRSRVR